MSLGGLFGSIASLLIIGLAFSTIVFGARGAQMFGKAVGCVLRSLLGIASVLLLVICGVVAWLCLGRAFKR